MAKKSSRITTLSFPCPTCGVPARARCLSIKPGITSRADLARMLDFDTPSRLIKSHTSRRMLVARRKSTRAPPG